MREFQSFLEIKSAIQERVISLPDLVETYLSNIRENKRLNAFLEVFESESRQKAIAIQNKIEAGKSGQLAGLVLGIKDNISYKDHNVSCGSMMLENYSSPYNSTALNNLLNEDAIIIGRLNCDEFGMGSSNENSAFGPCLNPLDESRVPGGSSGGSAAAVAANLCHAALGSDTGGSIRQPASFCGLVGLKPTYGQVSRHGLVAYASSFDQIGPIARSIEDAELIFKVLSSTCDFDATVNPQTNPDESSTLSFAIINESLSDRTQKEVRERTISLEEELKQKGHRVERIDFPMIEYIVPTYYVLTMAEASSNLARFDGIQYGNRSERIDDLVESIKHTRSKTFGKEVQRRIMMGNFVLSQEFADAYYNKAQRVRNLIRRKTNDVLKSFDYIVTPTSPTTAFKLDAKGQDPLTMYLMDIFTVQANLTGLPAISLPLFSDNEGLPIGVQFLTTSFSEQKLFKLGKYLYHQI